MAFACFPMALLRFACGKRGEMFRGFVVGFGVHNTVRWHRCSSGHSRVEIVTLCPAVRTVLRESPRICSTVRVEPFHSTVAFYSSTGIISQLPYHPIPDQPAHHCHKHPPLPALPSFPSAPHSKLSGAMLSIQASQCVRRLTNYSHGLA
ncbi:hypothetical protein HOY82DRAFT_245336 [Tuber indicum]|nr:hypothetical protein HOY82DRAFT_245336 [Tuber indicum]